MGYTLIITEKPSASAKIAAALAEGEPKEVKKDGSSYFRLKRKGEEIVVVPAVGHLFVLSEAKKGVKWTYPVFDVDWKPTYSLKGNTWAMKYYRNIESLVKGASSFVSACDYDIEGCTPYSEKIIVSDGKKAKIMEMGGLVDNVFSKNQTERWKEFEYSIPSDDLYIPCMDMNDFTLRFKKIKKVMRRKSDKSILKITTETGRNVHVSRNHPMFVLTENGIEVKKAELINEGDFVPVAKSLPFIDSEIKEMDLIEEITKRGKKRYYVYGIRKVIKLMPAEIAKKLNINRKTALGWRFFDRMPLWAYLKLESDTGDRKFLKIGPMKAKVKIPALIPLDRDFGRLVGYYLAEGCTDSGDFIGMYFGPSEKKYVDEVESILFRLSGLAPKKRFRTGMKGTFGEGNGWEIGTKSRILNFVFSEVLGLGRNAHTKRLPDFILSTPLEFYKNVIDAYLAGDGSLYMSRDRHVVSAASKSKELIEGLHLLLLKIGIVSTLVYDRKKNNHFIFIGIKRYLRKMISYGIDSLVSNRMKEGIMDIGRLDMKRDAFSYLPNFMLSGCGADTQTINNMRHSQRTSVASLTKTTPVVDRIINSNMHFLKVTKKEETLTDSEYLYDIETETGSFMHGNGIITHNSVIAWNILRFICKVKDGKRMKFSTLTPGDLTEAFEGASKHLDFPQIHAGLARHHMDWYFGINLSRALTLSLEHSGGFWTLSTGRVQGPTLKLLYQRQKSIEAFKPKPFWELQLNGRIDGKEILASHAKDKFWKQQEADQVLGKCKGKDGEVSEVTKQEKRQLPPTPFDLTTLQRDSYSLFSYSPKRTLDIAQSLYEGALISYPRTSSQKLPAKLGFKKILEGLAGQDDYRFLAKRVMEGKLKPNEGKKTDPAHPAIYPTGHKPKRLSAQQKKVYDLIVRRFLAVFGEPAVREHSRITILIEGEEFLTHGVRTLKPGWIDFYKPYARFKEQLLPDVNKGDKFSNEKLERLDKETQPPGRFSQASILKEMEELELGTKATRAGILQTLYDRGYIREQSIEVTDLGVAVVKALEKHCPEIISVELTRKFDKEMEQIEEGKMKMESVIKEAEEELRRILTDFKSHEKEIGTHIKEAVREYEKEIHTVGVCNKCGKGELRIIHSRRTGKRFVGCSNYPKCHNSFPLPQHGYVEVISRKCKCGLGLIQVRAKGRRPWRFCLVDKFEYYEKKGSKASAGSKVSEGKLPKKSVKKTARKE